MLKYSNKEDVVMADWVLGCNKRKHVDYKQKKNSAFKEKPKCKDKMDGSHAQLGADNQAFLISNPIGVSDKAFSDSTEETKRTQALGKNMGLYAQNEVDIVNVLANFHMEKRIGRSELVLEAKRVGKEEIG